MNYKACNHGSKYPYLLHKMGFVDSQFGTTVLLDFFENHSLVTKIVHPNVRIVYVIIFHFSCCHFFPQFLQHYVHTNLLDLGTILCQVLTTLRSFFHVCALESSLISVAGKGIIFMMRYRAKLFSTISC